MVNYCPHEKWTRGVVAKHAALSRPRSRVRIPSGPLNQHRTLIEEFHEKRGIFCFMLLIWNSCNRVFVHPKCKP